MKRTVTLVFIVLVLGIFAQASIVVDSYQGYHGGSDCAVCHNEPATAWNQTFADLEINADGVADEVFWQEPLTDYHTMYIPVAGSRGSDHMFIRTVFAQNSTHLFIKMDWEDTTLNGTEDNKYDDSDGFSIFWEMGEVSYDGGFPDGMVTDEGTLDVWTWKPDLTVEDLPDGSVNISETVAPVSSVIDHDFVMNNIGMGADSNQDVTVGASYGNQGSHHEDSYLVEVVRALETGDESDIQFSESGYYTFSLAIFNDASGGDHLMAFPHQVWIYGGPVDEPIDTDTDSTPLIGIVGIASFLVASATIVVRSRRQNR